MVLSGFCNAQVLVQRPSYIAAAAVQQYRSSRCFRRSDNLAMLAWFGSAVVVLMTTIQHQQRSTASVWLYLVVAVLMFALL